MYASAEASFFERYSGADKNVCNERLSFKSKAAVNTQSSVAVESGSIAESADWRKWTPKSRKELRRR